MRHVELEGGIAQRIPPSVSGVELPRKATRKADRDPPYTLQASPKRANMKPIMTALAFSVLSVALLVGCGPSAESIGETVKISMQQKFDSDTQFREWNLSVARVQVLKQDENRYQGIATVLHEGESHDVPVEITADGSDVIWQAPPGAFMFVAQKEIQRLQKAFE